MASHVRSLTLHRIRPGLALLAVVLVWWVLTAGGAIPSYLVPSPTATIGSFVDNPGYFWDNTLVTCWETLLGFALAVVIGVLAAAVMLRSPAVNRTLYPLLLFAQVIPKIAIAPLFVVWLGFGLTPKVVVAALMAFFPVVIAMTTGLRSVDPEMLELSATMGAGPNQTFWRIRVPASLPYLFSGLKVGATMAVTGAVVGEFVGANTGLGNVILQANGNVDTPTLFAGLIVMSLLGVALFALVDVLERVLIPWHASHRPTTL
jgi:NitT/TauT family transport system permease protein